MRGTRTRKRKASNARGDSEINFDTHTAQMQLHQNVTGARALRTTGPMPSAGTKHTFVHGELFSIGNSTSNESAQRRQQIAGTNEPVISTPSVSFPNAAEPKPSQKVSWITHAPVMYDSIIPRSTENREIPFEMSRYLTALLAQNSDGGMDGEELLDVMRKCEAELDTKFTYPRVRTKDSKSLQMSPVSRSPLERLPSELLDMIRAYLAPSDLVCLALTTKDTLQKIDYQLCDSKSIAAFDRLGKTIQDHKIDGFLAEQAFDVTERPDRDEL